MAQVYKTILIDDEELARLRLKRLLLPFADVIEVIGEAANGAEGLKLIEEQVPDLIFLDIEMPVLNGFEMLSKLAKQPKVVFTTAYDQYAIKAFEEESVDYLLKPIEAERLEKTIQKLERLHSAQPAILPLDALMRQLNIKKELKTLTIKIGDRILLIRLEDIAYIEAEDKYVFLHTVNGDKHLTDFTLAGLEAKLPENFIRIHRSTIINTDHIQEIRKGFNGAFVFVINTVEKARVCSSRNYGESLRQRFEI
jgi:two-component system LytT family response regulator